MGVLIYTFPYVSILKTMCAEEDKRAYSNSKSNFNDIFTVDLMGLSEPAFLSPQVSVHIVLFSSYCMFASSIWAPLWVLAAAVHHSI